MEQPLTLRWQSAEHYYTAMLTPDLFGGWMLVTDSGSRTGRSGRVQRKPLPSYAKGLDAIQQLRHRRRREGYELCGGSFAGFERFDPHDPDLRGAETNALLRLFEVWGLGVAEQAALLGVDAKTLAGYLDGRPLADDPALLARANHLLAIHKVLRLRYANDREIIRAWLRQPCPRLGEHFPLYAMLDGPDGLAALRRRLEQEADAFRGCPTGSATSH